MKRTPTSSTRGFCLLMALVAAASVLGLSAGVLAEGGGNPNPGIVPPHARPHGLSYGEWGAEWWKWAAGIPLAENPILDASGEFADVDQSGHVWFLAGNFGGAVERTVTVPPGTALFFPLVNSVFWAPNDLELAAFIAEEFFGLDPDDLTDEELIRLAANFQTDPAEMTLTIDGVEMQDLHRYRAESPGFVIEDTDLFDDLGVPIAEDNLAVAAGYWIMLTPLSKGQHTIRFTASVDNPFFGLFELDVTYNITVAKQ